MFFLAGAAAGSAMDLIASLTQTLSGSQTNTGVTTDVTKATSTFDAAASRAGATLPSTAGGTPATPPMTAGTMNALLAAQGQQDGGNSLSSKLFSLLDGDGNGSVSKTEFEQAFAKNGDTAKADSVFAKIDKNGDGSVSLSELASALKGGRQRHRGMDGMDAVGGASDGTSNDNSSGSTSKTVTNADGSVTTTITYSDGTKLSMTKPASSSGTTANNFLERMIQRQAQMLSASTAGQSVAVTA